MLFSVTTALIASLALAPQSDPAPDQVPTSSSEAVRLDDVEVTGRRLADMIDDFVGDVAAPVRGRGIARWNRSVCVGAVNFRADMAQYITDRVSTVAEDMGLTPGGPGCSPNIMVIGTDDGKGLAQAMVKKNRRVFRPSPNGTDLGNTALETFTNSDAPIRWWQVSVPVDSHTGDIAIRLPGYEAPQINTFSASRLTTQIVDSLARSIVIVDMTKLDGLNSLQLSDYVAMVSLAQIDAEADTSGFHSILNVPSDPLQAQSLTDWDLGYLGGLYSAERTQKGSGAALTEIKSAIRRSHSRLTENSSSDQVN